LREENEELRLRVRTLEEYFEVVVCLVRRHTPPPQLPSSSRTLGLTPGNCWITELSQIGYTDDLRVIIMRQRRKHYRPRLERTSKVQLQDDVETHRKRNTSSTTSSVFPYLPTNMSMLMHEEGFPLDQDRVSLSLSVQAPSSSLSLGRRRRGHGHKKSLSSNGNISPRTANFLMSEVAGHRRACFCVLSIRCILGI
jgi:hypothetical protein